MGIDKKRRGFMRYKEQGHNSWELPRGSRGRLSNMWARVFDY